MEILENGNGKDNITKRLNDAIVNVISKNDTSRIIDDKILELLFDMVDVDNEDIITSRELLTFLFLLESNKTISDESILVNNLITEIKMKTLRNVSMSIDSVSDDSQSNYSRTLSKKSTERERFVPSVDNEFKLPPEGMTINFTYREPTADNKRIFVRELLLDHDGYVVDTIREYYDDVYSNESEEIYSEKYLDALKECKSDKD